MDARGHTPGAAAVSRTLLFFTLLVALGSVGIRPARAQFVGAELARRLGELSALIDEGEYRQVFDRAELLLVEVETGHGVDSVEAARVLDLLVEAQLYLGQEGDSDPTAMARRAIRIKELRLGANQHEIAHTLRLLGTLLRQREEFDEARRALIQARDICANSTPSDSLGIAECLTELGTLETEAGNFVKALEYFAEDMEISRRLLPESDQQLARKLSNLARLYLRMGDFDEAVAHNLEAQTIMSAIDPEHIWLGYLLNSLGSIRADMGQHRLSLEAYESALTLARASLGEESLLMAGILNNIGVHYRELHDYPRAQAELEHCLGMMRRFAGEESANVAAVLGNLASVRQDQGAFDEAEQLFVDSIQMLSESVGDGHPSVGQRLWDLGWLHIEAGDPSKAEGDFQRSFDVRTESLPDGNYEIGQALHGRGRARHDLGRFESARVDYRNARSIIESSVGPEHPYLIRPQLDEGLLLAQSGNIEEAMQLARRSEELSRAYVLLTSRYLSEREALEFSEGQIDGTDLVLSLAGAVENPKYAWDQLVRSRAMILDEMAGRHAFLTDAGDAESERVARALAAVSRQYAGLLVQGPGSGGFEEYQFQLETKREALEDSERRLAELSDRFRLHRDRRDTGIDDVLERLGDDSALVSYVRFRRAPLGESSNRGAKRSDWPSVYAAFVVSSASATPLFISLGEEGEIDSLVRRWHREVISPLRRSSEGENLITDTDWKDRYTPVARELRRKIWDSIAPEIAGVQRVFIVPDGELHLVSWATLTTDDGRFLLEGSPSIHYMSAERDLLTELPKGSGLLAMGGVDYDRAPLDHSGRSVAIEERSGSMQGVAQGYRGDSAGCPVFSKLEFPPLAGSASEASAVANIWATANGAGATPTLLQGRTASESAFYREAVGKIVVHLATHGFVLGVDCASGAGTRSITQLAELPQADESHPPSNGAKLQLAGLALAGANLRAQAPVGEDDGILTAQEIASMDLGAAQWVVLSACNTGRGEIRTGEGVFGLRRAFQVAGARTLIMSLWPVDDESTESWMSALYRARFSDGMNTVEALRRASLSLLRERERNGESTHPFFWGGFVAAGSWR